MSLSYIFHIYQQAGSWVRLLQGNFISSRLKKAWVDMSSSPQIGFIWCFRIWSLKKTYFFYGFNSNNCEFGETFLEKDVSSTALYFRCCFWRHSTDALKFYLHNQFPVSITTSWLIWSKTIKSNLKNSLKYRFSGLLRYLHTLLSLFVQ